jgi:hypothetical protein
VGLAGRWREKGESIGREKRIEVCCIHIHILSIYIYIKIVTTEYCLKRGEEGEVKGIYWRG